MFRVKDPWRLLTSGSFQSESFGNGWTCHSHPKNNKRSKPFQHWWIVDVCILNKSMGFQGCSISRTAVNLNCFMLRPTHKMSLTSPPKQAVLKPHKAQAPWQWILGWWCRFLRYLSWACKTWCMMSCFIFRYVTWYTCVLVIWRLSNLAI